MIKIIKKRIRQGFSFMKKDKPALLTFLFHSIFRDEKEITQNHIDPQQHITVDIYKNFTDYFLNVGYKFITPNDLSKELDPAGRYILSTFDDGYYNNSYVLPILKEYQTPAIFFISTNNILNNKCFWWDVVYRELAKKGLSRKEISKEQKKIKSLKYNDIISSLKMKYGENVFTPISDIDRPFSVAELKQFEKNEFVHIGNHTSNHYILDKYSFDEQYNQIHKNNVELEQIIGYKPKVIAYPNGNYNDDSIAAAHKLGFEYGITVEKYKNSLPLKTDIKSKLTLGRYVLWGNENLKVQCDILRTNGCSK